MSETKPAQRSIRAINRFTGLASSRRNLSIGLCVLVAALADGFGIATLLPMIAVLGDHGHEHKSHLAQTMLQMFHNVGITPTAGLLLGIVVAGTLIKAGLMVLALRQIGYAVADVTTALRVRLVNGVIGARWSYYASQPVGRFSNALSNEATQAGEAYTAAMLMLLQAMQAIVYLAVAAVLSWKLALFILFVSVLMLALLNHFLHIAKRSAATQFKLLRVILSRLSDVLVGIKPLKAMARDSHVVNLFKRDLNEMKIAAQREVLAKNVNRALQEPIIALCLVAGIFAALWLLNLPLGEVIVMSLLLAKVVLVVGRAQQQLQKVQSAEHGLKSVQRITAEADAAVEQSTGLQTPQLTRGIEFQHVSFSYGGQSGTLHDINIDLPKAQIIALTGPSGAGKTTFTDLLLGLRLPGTGSVRVDGAPLADLNRHQWRQMVGYAPQEVIMFHDSVLENVTLGETDHRPEDIERALRDAAAWDYVSRLPDGLNTLVGERGSLLSGGQRQRLALARSLVRNPRLLILDEATSALDPATETEVIANIRRRVQDDKLTVLSISHHPAWVRAADRVLKMEAGQLSELDPAQAHLSLLHAGETRSAKM